MEIHNALGRPPQDDRLGCAGEGVRGRPAVLPAARLGRSEGRRRCSLKASYRTFKPSRRPARPTPPARPTGS